MWVGVSVGVHVLGHGERMAMPEHLWDCVDIIAYDQTVSSVYLHFLK